MLEHPWVLGWAAAQGDPGMGMLLGERRRGKSLLGFLQQPRLGRPHPLCQRRVAEGHHGSPSSRETRLTLCTLPRNKGREEGGEGGCKLCITTN